MAEETPQKISAILDPRIFSIAATAMKSLVHPTPNAAVLEIVPQLMDAVDAITIGADQAVRGCLHAGLWLLADELPKAHVICQDIATAHGSAWHGHLHRREGDFSNAKYWWRRAGNLRWQAPENPPLHEQASALLDDAPRELLPWRSELQAKYDPARFVDLVEKHYQEQGKVTDILREVQRLEWKTLFLECLAAAQSGRN